MYLRSLELQGFKSFPDRIRLDFDKGITAVVGPNGSGKSNIGDAVRWVLGEQSSKTLRGSKMEDVIFAGTQLRKPMGFAQVTLDIANDDHTLPLDDDDVAVTRKLYRSGESEYMINGKPCRLKDICELFMDTGMGRDGYSIIGQGRIAEIISARSGERRDIFEEAAGIAKFRFRKEEAENKLKNAEENILRLNDIVSALEARVEPLRIQSEKAQKFLTLSERKKTAEITVWVHELDDIKKTLGELEDRILINTGEYDSTEAEIEQTEQRMQELARDMQDSSVRIEELRQKIHDLEQAETKLHSEIAVCENEIGHCEQNIAEYEEKRKNAANSDAETEKEAKAALDELSAAEKDISENRAECVKAENALSELADRQTAAEKALEEKNIKLNSLNMTRSRFTADAENRRAETDNLRAQLAVGNERSENADKELSALEEEKKNAVSAREKLDITAAEQQNKLSGLERLLKSKSDRLSETEDSINAGNIQISELEQRIKVLRELESSMEGFNNAVRQVLRAASNKRLGGICGTVPQLISVSNEYSTAVETALGGALQNIVTENEEAAKAGIAWLKSNNAGRATFLPLTSIRGNKLNERGLAEMNGFVAIASELVTFDEKYRNIIEYTLGRTAVAEDLDTAAVIAKRFGYRFRIVTLDGQVINAGGSFTGGSASRSGGVLTRKAEIDELTEKRDMFSEKLRGLKEHHTKLKAETEKLRFDTEAQKDKMRVIEQDKIRFEEEIKRIDQLYSQTRNAMMTVREQYDIIMKRISELGDSAESSEKEISRLDSEISALEAGASADTGLKERLTGEKDALLEKISQLKIREAELIKDKQAIKDRIDRIEERRRISGDDTVRLLKMTEEQKNIIAEKKQRIEECRQELMSSKDRISAVTDGITDVQAESREKEKESTMLRRRSRELSDKKESFASERTRLEERKNNVTNSRDEIINSMAEQYEIYPSEAESIAEEVSDMPALRRELADLKQKIRSLGSVNVAAIEEYKEVSGQYEFMSGELKDVETSKKKLEDLIDELTETMKKQFSDSFALITKNFKEVFSELFGGGSADLALTDPENVLGSGIEINVAPPGKVIKSLSLLSGGEQAFVAIALYFAIFKIKPSPFCILDEIEAALDDVNVTRYAQYLRHFTDTTQFIAITHRRGTMEEADVLYGVTMQQKGISKLLKMEQPPPEDIN